MEHFWQEKKSNGKQEQKDLRLRSRKIARYGSSTIATISHIIVSKKRSNMIGC